LTLTLTPVSFAFCHNSSILLAFTPKSNKICQQRSITQIQLGRHEAERIISLNVIHMLSILAITSERMATTMIIT